MGKKSYIITTTPLGRQCGLYPTEEVILDDADAAPRIIDGALVFAYNVDDICVYAPGMWVTLVGSAA